MLFGVHIRLLVCKKEKMVMCPGLVRWQGRSTSSGIFVLTVYWSKVTANIERDVSGRPTSTAKITLPPPRHTGKNRHFHCSFGNCRPSCYFRYIAQRITWENYVNILFLHSGKRLLLRLWWPHKHNILGVLMFGVQHFYQFVHGEKVLIIKC